MRKIIAILISAVVSAARAAEPDMSKCPMFGATIWPQVWAGYSSPQKQLWRSIKAGDVIPLNQFVNKTELAKIVADKGSDQFIAIVSSQSGEPVADGSMIGICAKNKNGFANCGSFHDRRAINATNLDSLYLSIIDAPRQLIYNTRLQAGGLKLIFISGEELGCPERSIVDKRIGYNLDVTPIYDKACPK
ncbi:MAG: hypothetical protein LBL46_00265 [Rickettsiales bacterium]|jgi:hypothetical protein|nr:hypothetical protein [Rickettsiales bacterium]